MLFSASTMRVRWLHGSSALEKRVITAVRCWVDVRRGGSLHVFPVLLFEEIGEEEKDQQEGQYSQSNATPFQLHRFPDVVEEVHSIAHELVELLRVEGAGLNLAELLEALVDSVMFGVALAVVNGFLQALTLPQDVRHRRTRQHQVVDAGGPTRIDVERFQRSEEHTSELQSQSNL